MEKLCPLFGKGNVLTIIGTSVVILFSLTACPIIEHWEEFETSYKPILMNRNDLENSIRYIDERPIERPGKIYYKDSIVFINEKYKGVHMIDNHVPTNPIYIGFVSIPGCIDIAMKGNILYADNATDLVAISLADHTNPQITKRIEKRFPELDPPDGGYLPQEYLPENRPKNTVIIEWIEINQ